MSPVDRVSDDPAIEELDRALGRPVDPLAVSLPDMLRSGGGRVTVALGSAQMLAMGASPCWRLDAKHSHAATFTITSTGVDVLASALMRAETDALLARINGQYGEPFVIACSIGPRQSPSALTAGRVVRHLVAQREVRPDGRAFCAVRRRSPWMLAPPEFYRVTCPNCLARAARNGPRQRRGAAS